MNTRNTGANGNGMQCGEFDALLTEALDGRLDEFQMGRFRAHAASCRDCQPLFELATSGMEGMRGLPEVEPPRNLVHNILVATSGVEAVELAKAPAIVGWNARMKAWLRPALGPLTAPFAQPRFAMSFGMAFFGVTLFLNMAGLRVSDLRYVDWRPSALQTSVVRQYTDTTAKVVKYYENIRLVYELESRIRDLKNAALTGKDEEAEEQQKKQQEEKQREDEKKQKPEQNRNYSFEQSRIVVASAASGARQEGRIYEFRSES